MKTALNIAGMRALMGILISFRPFRQSCQVTVVMMLVIVMFVVVMMIVTMMR